MNKISAGMLTLMVALTCAHAQTGDFPYRFNPWIDLSLIPAGITAKKISDVFEDEIPVYGSAEIENLSRENINALERFATYKWSPGVDNTGDILLALLLSAPAGLLVPDIVYINEQERWKNILHLSMMYGEIYFLTQGITNLTQALTRRNRPFLYNTSLPVKLRLEEAQDVGAYQSFFSGHTSGAFASAVFLAKVFQDRYGRGTMSRIIWGTSLGLASAAGIARVYAGKHFPTDVLTGAVVGAGIGFLVPQLHKVNRGVVSLLVHPGTVKVTVLF
jgi:membrane-associated phospholipid phosphatase